MEITFFISTKRINFKVKLKKVKFRKASNHCKRVLEAAKLAYATKTKEYITSRKPDSQDFWRIANSVLSKGKSAIPPLFNGPEVLSSASDKAKLFVKRFSENSYLEDSGISLTFFFSGTNLKLHNISVTPKMVKKVIANLDSSKVSDPDCIPVVVLKNCEPELFNMCLKEPCFPDCWKVSSVVPVFNNGGEKSAAKCYPPVSLLSVVSKVFEKLVNNRIVDHLKKCGFLSSQSTADLLTVVSDRIARAFNRSGATVNDYNPRNMLITKELRHSNAAYKEVLEQTNKQTNKKESARKTKKSQKLLSINEEKLKCV